MFASSYHAGICKCDWCDRSATHTIQWGDQVDRVCWIHLAMYARSYPDSIIHSLDTDESYDMVSGELISA